MDSFLSFYSMSKKTIRKLSVSDSIAVTDDVFLVIKVNEVPEFQSEAKKLLMEDSGTYAENLEKMYKNHRAQGIEE